jgi:hypothetical protein
LAEHAGEQAEMLFSGAHCTPAWVQVHAVRTRTSPKAPHFGVRSSTASLRCGTVAVGQDDFSAADVFRDDPLSDSVRAGGPQSRSEAGDAHSTALERELVGVRAALARTQADAEGLADKLLSALTQQQAAAAALSAETERVTQLTQVLGEQRVEIEQLRQALRDTTPEAQALREANESLRMLMAERDALQAELTRRPPIGAASSTDHALAANKLLAALEAAEADRDAAIAMVDAERARADAASASASAAEAARKALADRALAAWESAETARRERDAAMRQLSALQSAEGVVEGGTSAPPSGSPVANIAVAMVAALAIKQRMQQEREQAAGQAATDGHHHADVVERLRRRNATREIE